MKKKIGVSIILIMILSLFTSVYAGIEDVIGHVEVNNVDNELAGKIIGAFQWIGYAIAIGMIVFIGVKYMMAAAGERADMKGALIKYVIGALLIAGATTIASWIFNGIF